MENLNSSQNGNKQLTPLYLLIGGLFAALIFQFFYFSHKVDAAKKQASTATADEPFSPSGFPSYFSRSRHTKNAANFPGAGILPDRDFFAEDPFEALDQIHSRLNNMMATARTYAPIVMQQMNRDLSSDFIPAVDMEETEAAYVVRADIPGLEKDKINITAENGILVIQGTRETQTEQNDPSGMYTAERHYGSFARTVALPGPVDEAGIKADYKNGVLTVQVPKEKNAPAPSKRIPVQ